MTPKRMPYAVGDEIEAAEPLTEQEKAAVRRAEADIVAGRVHHHDEVTKWLRRRAKEIEEREHRRDKSN